LIRVQDEKNKWVFKKYILHKNICSFPIDQAFWKDNVVWPTVQARKWLHSRIANILAIFWEYRKFIYSFYNPPNFRLYFTLSSEYFLTFAQATCFLSVSLKYLVLEVITLPISHRFVNLCYSFFIFHLILVFKFQKRKINTVDSKKRDRSNTETNIIQK